RAAGSLAAVLDDRAGREPERLAYRFLPEGEEREELLGYGELAISARALAGGLLRAGATGKPVLLCEPPGRGFLTGLFACWYAGAIAVPAYPPRGSRHRRRFEAIRQDSGAVLALGPAAGAELGGLSFLDAAELSAGDP